MKRIKEINEALPTFWLSILFFGIVSQVVGVFFVENKAGYSIGLWIGILTAMFMAFHMAYVLYVGIDKGERGAQTFVVKHNMIRYGVIIIILGILMLTDIANPLAAFLGIMGLKVGAYLQPLTYKILGKQGKSAIVSKTKN